ncbi:MAG: hypothetical protein ONB13_02560, partial [candidate division KSB1 bacterium]|nr:hypothetical protein [candidate division KSB1 bacterium]
MGSIKNTISRLPWIAKTGLSLVLLALIFTGLLWIVPFPHEKLRPQPSTVVLDRHGTILRVFLSSDQMWHIPV